MNKNDVRYDNYVSILEEELLPAMGCTEPIALAYASATARELLGALPERVEVGVSGSIIKNVKSVVVPNTGGLRGIEAAVSAGVVAGNSHLKLEVLSRVTPEQLSEIKQFYDDTPIEIMHLDSDQVFDIVITLFHGIHSSKVRIAGFHTNIVYKEKDREVLFEIPVSESGNKKKADRTLLDMKGIWDFANTVDIEDVRENISKQIDFNLAIAEEGMRGKYGANIGKVLLKYQGDQVHVMASAMAAAGSDARMSGCELPVIINSGSGNQGITVSVPVLVYAKATGADEEKTIRALVLSNLCAIHQKTMIGYLSAYCGAVTAGAGAGAGIAYICGGGYKEVIHTVVNALAVTSGMVCDGAKPSCAAKIAAAVDAGILGYQMYKEGQQFYGGDGIITKGIEGTIQNVGRLGRDGMKQTNDEIIKIMIEK